LNRPEKRISYEGQATRNRQGDEEHAGYGKDGTEEKLIEFKAHVQCWNRQRVNVKNAPLNLAASLSSKGACEYQKRTQRTAG
jgi:hypothetical protein